MMDEIESQLTPEEKNKLDAYQIGKSWFYGNIEDAVQDHTQWDLGTHFVFGVLHAAASLFLANLEESDPELLDRYEEMTLGDCQESSDYEMEARNYQ